MNKATSHKKRAPKKRAPYPLKIKDFRNAAVRTAHEDQTLPLGNPTPADDYLLVQQSRPPKVSEGGIALPDNAFEEPLPYGLIVKAGVSCKKYEVGQYVLISKFGGHPWSPDGKTTWIFIRESDVVGTLQTLSIEPSGEAPPLNQDGLDRPAHLD